MGIEPTKTLQLLYRTPPMACPYLPGRVEQQVFGELSGDDSVETFRSLTHAGFRRSHGIVYRPACPACDACVPVRIPTAEFAPNRTMRRIARINADLRAEERPPVATAEQQALFTHYLESRHGDSEMARMDFDDYRAMVEGSAIDTRLVEFRDREGRLLGTMLSDWFADGASAVYSFFRNDEPKRSLGNYMVVWLIEQARRTGREHVYLGYWIADSPKMAYKTRFRPIEALGPHGWRRMPDDTG